MDDKEKKEYIIKNMKYSNGKKITEMLLRYWNLKDNSRELAEENLEDNSRELAEEIFKDEKM